MTRIINPYCKFALAALLVAMLCGPVSAETRYIYDELFNLDFGGGSVEQLVVELKKAQPELNIIVSDPERAKSIEVPPLALKQIHCGQLGDLLQKIVPIRYDYIGTDTMVILVSGRTVPAVPPTLFVYPLESLLEVYTLKDINAVLLRACEVMQVEAPDFYVHDETSMLMASVTTEQLKIVRMVLQNLEPSVEKRGAAKLKNPRFEGTINKALLPRQNTEK